MIFMFAAGLTAIFIAIGATADSLLSKDPYWALFARIFSWIAFFLGVLLTSFSLKGVW
jgi:cytochrome c biogenesis protein CcdA